MLSMLAVALFMQLSLATPAVASGICDWVASSGSWFDRVNWYGMDCPGVPSAGDHVEISHPHAHVTIDGGAAVSAHLGLSYGQLSIINGGTLTSSASYHNIGWFGRDATMRITGAGSAWNATVTSGSSGIRVGVGSDGTLILDDGGTLTVSGAGNRLILGEATTSGTTRGRGTLVIGAPIGEAAVAPGFVNTNEIEMGRGDDGDGAKASGLIVFNHTDTTGYTFSPDIFGVGKIRQEYGTTVLTGTNTYTGDTIVNDGVLRAGSADSFVQNGAYIVNGGSLQLNGYNLTMSSLSGDGGEVVLGRVPQGMDNVTLTIDQERNTTFRGSLGGAAHHFSQGRVTLLKDGTGSLTLTGTSVLTNFYNNSGVRVDGGELVLAESGTLRAHWLIVGKDGQDATLRVVGSGSEYSGASSIQVGSVGGQAVISVEDGGVLKSGNYASIAHKANSTGSVVLSGGSSWHASDMYVGENGAGTLTIAEGSEVKSAYSVLGEGMDARGTVTVSDAGSKWLTSDHMIVGDKGTADLDISGGGRVEVGAGGPRRIAVLGNGSDASGHVTVTGAGSVLRAGELIVGNEGEAELVVAGGAKVDAFDIFVGRAAGSSGVLRIGDGGAAGEVVAQTVTFGQGDGVLEFNHIDSSHSFAARLMSGSDGQGVIRHLAGTTRLTGDSSGFSGQTDVGGGILVVDGVLGGTLTVGNGAVLGGRGVVGATTVESGGVLSPGGSIGTLTIDGDLTMKAGSKYEVEVNPDGSESDLLSVTGAATLEGGSIIHVGAYGNYKPLSTYRIFKADGGLSGEFAEVTFNFAFLTPTLVYVDADNAVDLKLARNDIRFEDKATTRNQKATANGVDSVGLGNDVFDTIASLPDDERVVGAALDALSGEVHASVRGARLGDGNVLRRIIVEWAQRVASGDDSNIPWTGAAPAAVKPVFDWVQLVTDHSRMQSDGNAAAVKHSTTGFAVGADKRLANEWNLGLGFGYTRSTFDIADRSSSAASDDFHLGMYADTERGKFALRGGLAHTAHGVKTERIVKVGALSETLKSTYGAGTTQGFAEAGYRLGTKRVAFEPFIHVAHAIASTNGFHEQGGSAALSAAAQRTELTSATLGVRAASAFTVGNMYVTAGGALGWTQSFGVGEASSTHAFAGGRDFTVSGVPAAGDAAHAEAGLEWDLSAGFSLGVAYKGRFTSGTPDQSLHATLGVRF